RYGQAESHRLAKPVWQMVWLTLFISLLIIPIASVTIKYVVPDAYQQNAIPYYKIMLFTIPLLGYISAISAFFIGQNKFKLVLYSGIFVSIINVVLDIGLVFGRFGMPTYGPRGCAIAAIVSLSIQAIIITCVFLNRHHRRFYHTADFTLDLPLLWKSIKYGVPASCSHIMEFAAWALLGIMLAKFGSTYITVFSLGSTLYILYGFVTDGLNRTAMILTATSIGAKLYSQIKTICNYHVLLLVVLVLMFFGIMYAGSGILFRFLALEQGADNMSSAVLHYSAVGLCLYFFLDGLIWIFAGVLTAMQETKYIMYSNVLSIWFLGVLPLLAAIYVWHISIDYLWYLLSFYAAVNALLLMLRVKQGYLAYLLKTS
ncbi:MAG: hypothetical protein K5Q00_01525, partial [Gammaproteobacteria bacterium]|nr:hypothetical protein [Gammaproteobacteria bacterium]